MSNEFYPDHLLPIVREMEVTYQRFAELREQVLIDHPYNTARAYWGDLDDMFRWAAERGKDVLSLSEKDIRQYVGLLRRRQYSESTVRRRITSLRKLYVRAIECGERKDNPAARLVVRRKVASREVMPVTRRATAATYPAACSPVPGDQTTG